MAARQIESDPGDRTECMGTALKRRGLIAGAAALVAGIVAKQTSQPVAAYTRDDTFEGDNFNAVGNTGSGFNTLGGFYPTGVYGKGSNQGVHGIGDGTKGIGVQGDGSGSDVGVYGTTGGGNAAGVYGTSSGATGFGVGGLGSGANGTGVSGIGNGNGAGVSGGGGLYGVKGSVGNSGYGVHGTAGIGYGVYGTAPTGIGVGGDSSNVGVAGRGGGDTSGNTTGFPIGVRGSVPNTGYGVYGNAGNGTGVYGNATGGIGVNGVAVSGSGVQGTSSTGATTKGVYGHHASNGYGVVGDAGDGGYGVTGVGTTSYGVVGQSTGGIGVYGGSTNDTGVYGTGKNYGVRGDAGSGAGSAGLLGFSNIASGVAFGSVVSGTATIAGYFNGEVHVEGPFYVDPVSNKHGVIAHADGTKRVLYSMESPESWIEDFGTGTLVGGKATIALDKDFAAIVHADDYYVFLTERDAHHHLTVIGQTPTGFTVEADAEIAVLKGKKAADLGGRFAYRVVAKPNVGKVVERLPKYTKPNFRMPDPAPPLPTKKP